MDPKKIENPFRPGAGHMPPYLAGRTAEQDEMKHLLRQRVVLSNLVLTGLRGVGKTVLLKYGQYRNLGFVTPDNILLSREILTMIYQAMRAARFEEA